MGAGSEISSTTMHAIFILEAHPSQAQSQAPVRSEWAALKSCSLALKPGFHINAGNSM